MSAAMSTPGFVSFGSMPYDDVYLEDGSSEGEDENVISDTRKPLMSPRTRPKVALRQPKSAVGVYPLIKKRVLKWFYVLITCLFISLLVFVLIRITYDARMQIDDSVDGKEPGTSIHKNPATPTHKNPPVNSGDTKIEEKEELIPCSDFDVQDVWVQNFPKLITETAFRLVDVNKDGVLDVIMGFSTGVTSYFADEYLLCDIYFNGSRPCFGGMMALDGVTGVELWRHYADNEIFAVNCNVDIDKDGVKDCVGGGRAGAFELVSGATGHMIWKFQSKELLVSISNFYTAQFIQDVDGDGIKDVLNIHGGDPLRKPGEEATHFGLLVIVSGATGHVITSMEVPDQRESYYSPQIYYQHGGKEMVLFGTGGETHGGSLWVIAMADLLMADNTKAIAIYTDNYKGIMTPPVLADITGDGVVDIVMAMFNSTTVAFDGQSYKQLWNYTMASSESYSTPGAAYYNDDNVPDFMITYSHGPGYPVYYYGQVTILDGRTGQPILTPPLQTAGSSQVSPLSVSMEGYGNDLYLYFILDCLGHEGESNEFTFSKADDNKGIGQKSRSDFCMQRFHTKSFSRLSLLSRQMKLPGQQIYNSLDRDRDEYKYTVNSSLLAEAYLVKYPHVLQRVKELLINDPDGHDHEETGMDHSQERGDQEFSGRVHSDDMGDTDLNKLFGEEDDFLDQFLNQKEKQNVKSAPRLGFDNEDEIPYLHRPIDSQPGDNQHHPSQLDSYPERKYPQDVDPPNSNPVDYPQKPHPPNHQPLPQPLGSDSLDALPSTGDEDDADSGMSNQLMNKLLTRLLQDEDIEDLVHQQLDETRGYKDRKDLAGSNQGDAWRYDQQPENAKQKVDSGEYDGKKWLDDRYGDTQGDRYGDTHGDSYGDTHGDRYGDTQGSRYGDTQGSRYGGRVYDRYGDTNRDETRNWLDGFPDQSKRYYRNKRSMEEAFKTKEVKKRDLNPTLKDSQKFAKMSAESISNELFLKLSKRDDAVGIVRKRRDTETKIETKKHQPDDDGKPVEYIDNDLFLKLKQRESGILEEILRWLEKRPASERANRRESLSHVLTNHRERNKRHLGPHDAGGIQRLISTGTLAPVLIGQEESSNESIDLIFATYWFYPADTQLILPEQQECIDTWMAKESQRLDPTNVFYGIDHDAYEHMATDKCTETSTAQQRRQVINSMNPLDIYPFNIHTGELTVYRLRLTCRCNPLGKNERCAKVLPYERQQWGAYMGTNGNSHFPTRH